MSVKVQIPSLPTILKLRLTVRILVSETSDISSNLIASAIDAVCPGGEGAVLKTVGR